jgi:hypothetical protein
MLTERMPFLVPTRDPPPETMGVAGEHPSTPKVPGCPPADQRSMVVDLGAVLLIVILAGHRPLVVDNSVTVEPSAATQTQVLSCSGLDRPELGPRLFGRDLQVVDLSAVLLDELDEFVLGSLRGPAALALDPVLHAPTSSRAGY